MPEELDPTTARLVSELAASMIPALSKALNSAVPVNDFLSALERNNMVSLDMRNQIDKALRSGVEDSRAARSLMLQSVRNITDEVSLLKKSVEKFPDTLEYSLKNIKSDNTSADILQELARLSELINELISGIKYFSETFAEKNSADLKNLQSFETTENSQILNENNIRLDKLLNDSLPGLEGLLKAQGKTQSHEFREFSREITAQNEQNNIAMINEVRETVENELSRHSAEQNENFDSVREKNIMKFLKLNMIFSVIGTLFAFILIILMIFR